MQPYFLDFFVVSTKTIEVPSPLLIFVPASFLDNYIAIRWKYQYN